MKNLLRIVAVCLLCSGLCCYAEGQDLLDKPHVSLQALEASSTALRLFLKEQKGIDKRHFRVFIDESGKDVEVAFVPDPSPASQGCKAADCYITMDVGGETVYGRSVTYVFSKENGELVKVIHPR
jgi:hypothetical protein